MVVWSNLLFSGGFSSCLPITQWYQSSFQQQECLQLICRSPAALQATHSYASTSCSIFLGEKCGKYPAVFHFLLKKWPAHPSWWLMPWSDEFNTFRTWMNLATATVKPRVDTAHWWSFTKFPAVKPPRSYHRCCIPAMVGSHCYHWVIAVQIPGDKVWRELLD